MLWSDNLAYDFEKTPDGSLKVFETGTVLLKTRLMYGIFFGLFISILLRSFGIIDVFGNYGLGVFVTGFIGMILIWFIPIKVDKKGKLYFFDKSGYQLSLDNKTICRLENLLIVNFKWLPDPENSATTINVNDPDNYEVGIEYLGGTINLQCFNERLLAVILAEEICVACGLHSHYLYNGTQSKTMQATTQQELYKYEMFMSKYSAYTDEALEERISLENVSNTTAYKAASTVLRRRKQMESKR